MPANALHRQIETVGDLPTDSTRPVDRHLAIDLIGGKDDHPADRVSDADELFALHFRDFFDDVRHPRMLREGRNCRIARQPELADFGAVV
jgi:hypothetical protein